MSRFLINVMHHLFDKDIQSIIDDYKSSVTEIESSAKYSKERAYGGVVRAGKGALVERIAKKLVEIAWRDLGGEGKRLSLERETIKIPLNEDYLKKIKSPEVRKYIAENIKDYHYPLKTDVHVHIDRKFRIAIECKAYTENAMLKRILVDFTLFKQVFSDLSFVLLQLESQLGGDYSEATKTKYGSPSTHTLLSYFDVDLNIITLMRGERKVERPIHKQKYYKLITRESLLSAVEALKELLPRN
jgi:hypothetical protein